MTKDQNKVSAPRLWLVLARAYGSMVNYIEGSFAAQGLGLSAPSPRTQADGSDTCRPRRRRKFAACHPFSHPVPQSVAARGPSLAKNATRGVLRRFRCSRRST